jgi:methylenetetrahydrofolate reductase (NADPH)
MENRFKEALLAGEFVVTAEAIPGRGAFEEAQEHGMKEAEEFWATGKVHAVSVTDNPSGLPALLADGFVADLKARGIVPLCHFTGKDRNRNQILSQLYALERAGIDNLLLMTGDYPGTGWKETARPVFDLDSVHLAQLVTEMNNGLKYEGRKGEVEEVKSNFFKGVVVNPFKWTEAEVYPQYFKLDKKIFAGGDFIISQLGYNARKMEELIFFLKHRGYSTPAIANIFVISAPIARAMNKGSFPGCIVADEMVAVIEEEAKAEDKGRSARYTRAAKMVAIAKGMGYAGVHIGGIGLTGEAVDKILDEAKSYEANWKEVSREFNYKIPGDFYLFQEDKETGLNTTELSPRNELSNEGSAVYKRHGVSLLFHNVALEPGRFGYNRLANHMDKKEKKKGEGFHSSHMEHDTKVFLYGCLDCGDCGLETIAYQCPMVHCPKSQRNGPCGGGDGTWCEVFPASNPHKRHCVFYNAYNRFKKEGHPDRLGEYIVPPNNWDFFHTSAWSNYTHHRDNAAKRIPIK